MIEPLSMLPQPVRANYQSVRLIFCLRILLSATRVDLLPVGPARREASRIGRGRDAQFVGCVDAQRASDVDHDAPLAAGGGEDGDDGPECLPSRVST